MTPQQGARNVFVTALVLAAAATALVVSGIVDTAADPVGSFGLHPLVLAAMFLAAEASVVHVQIRRQTLTISLSEIPLILGLFFVGPGVLLATRLGGSAIALVAVRRQPRLKAAYNIALFAFETACALAIFRAMVGADPFGPRGWASAQVAGLAAITLGTMGVAFAIRLTEGSAPASLVRGFVTMGVPTTFVNVTLGLLAVELLQVDDRTGLLLLGLSWAMVFFYRSHTQLQTNHRSLTELYAATGAVDDALERGDAVQTLLDRSAELMRAELADLVRDDPSGESIRYVWDASTRELTTETATGIARERRVALGGESAVVLSGKRDSAALAHVGATKDAVIVGLRGKDVLAGTLMVANRLGNVATFTDDDRRLFEALGNHASIAMRNSTLVERLRVEIVEREHEAFHDRLTGLPNRTMFDREVDAAVDARRGGELVAVMLIDLDRFKEVNDTLGHQQGDRLLEEVSSRFAAAVEGIGLVARQGGDEFAVLVPRCQMADDAVAIAERLRESLEVPIDLGGLPISVGASVGLAFAPDDADDSESLLQRADVAMYRAKQTSGIERYHASANHYTPERLAMVAELRRAVMRGELLVEYQPCVDLRTGAIRAVEGLARWHHPTRGFVPPDEFIPIAERSGLIPELTTAVMRTALLQCAAWRADGLTLRVAVNLSARSLVDGELPGTVADLLAESGLPPTALALEITESSIMEDPARTIAMLNRLSSMGVTLAVDDYGTGYSSLAYLKNLPVDELKLDRTFVTDMLTDGRDRTIVSNTITLAHELGLRVVAEGVEDQATQDALADMGCDLGQGYHICRPRTASQIHALATGDAPVTSGSTVTHLDDRRRRTTS